MKTEKLLKYYYKKLIEEQDMEIPEDGGVEDPSMAEGGDVSDAGVTDVVDEPQEVAPLTSEGELFYIENLVDAALFVPSEEDSMVLQELQTALKLKNFENARSEFLPTIINIIKPSTEQTDIRKDLNEVD